ncbi:hypothetical protein A3D85_00885 [Candidatus Amesbacteria bacterium RIFCSPHIGHO2_02_FULL_47_9]|uniref:Uncharacterized protein n=1 Tax=Candidatus Amesbacteria bacterium RIFCSPHIGHO2_01_FULL_48_32b TaxID=1797253 RepID=A0A1F4YCB5_9BACT|nr:MAG: hypothetical protein A2876_03625 [Candidatus Amesbacteria bacterium RIFCSPHIGHO2_01_FULL_48_32b]OGD04595.1 MAG: hypothetical protein A3D85_00885 [Candidatus Amesbacteria bacterium RIFCSPHIGHO2_02_FULL_47_9]OGD06776.1 MAG: hypothetical protein A2899_05325 [Candidatus Amesbacteria bacterium RIFCSPLOWO2_01_FULL_49_25]
MDGHSTDYSKITERIYIGSDLCRGPTCPVHTEEFKKLGICGEINMEIEHPEMPPKSIDAYLWLPVVDKQAPTQDQLRLGTVMMKQMIDLGNTIYVHCKNGHGRSPTLVAAYLIRFEGKTVDEAIRFIKEKRPEVHLEEVQIEALNDLIKR